MKAIRTRDYGKVLTRRLKKDRELSYLVDEELLNAEIAQQLYDARIAKGLTQSELADLVGTSQSVIARLESADYRGRTTKVLLRIAKAMGMRVEVQLKNDDPVDADQNVNFSGSIRFEFFSTAEFVSNQAFAVADAHATTQASHAAHDTKISAFPVSAYSYQSIYEPPNVWKPSTEFPSRLAKFYTQIESDWQGPALLPSPVTYRIALTQAKNG